ncbi:hypothetical protein [Rhodopseudomonas sp. P2A-2r]|uniref:hypothetical protein n=1 Tax=unclassified Rhodopseudomonas TaxID=2638247 RepID=UPI002233E882|nr:hypothetical protein [Rhodopseudomonas sp. P2A-2r]UZE48222.1 hypothetical protein ONR75_25890 [Rhodopseudomonas sp. P2A-2r]
MARTTIWDEAFLKQRAVDARAAALARQTDADWERAQLQIKREVSDVHRGFVRCPDKRCRRARHCRPAAYLACFAVLRVRLPHAVEQELIEYVYAEMQALRRDAADVGTEVECER